MPRFVHLFDAAEDTLNAYYQAIAQRNIDNLMGLWIDEEFVTCVSENGVCLQGLPAIRKGLAEQISASSVTIEPLEVHVYDSLGTVVYAIIEARCPIDPALPSTLVFTTCVMVHERGKWRIAHLHTSRMPDAEASTLSTKLSHRQGALH